MDTERFEWEKIAIKHYAKIIREEIDLNRGKPVKKHQLGGVLNERASYIAKHVKKHYSPQPLRNFLAAHPKVFFVFGSGKETEVNVASEIIVADYICLLDSKSFASGIKSNESSSDLDIEVEAINFFTKVFRNRALEDKSCTSGVILKKDFPVIFSLAPREIRDFVSKEFKRKNLPSSFDQFIKQHGKIFPESFSGLSVRVKSEEEVLAYVVEVFGSSDPDDSSSNERNSSTPESQSSSSTGSTPLISCDDQTVIIYFEAQFRSYMIRNVMSWIKLDNLALFYRDAPTNIINYLKKYYGRCYLSTFLNKYSAIFPKSPCGLFFTILTNAEVEKYLATFPILQPSQHIQRSSLSSSNSQGVSRPLLDTPKQINLQEFLVPTLKTSPKHSINVGNSTLTSNNTTLTATSNPGNSLFANVSSQETIKTINFLQSTSLANTLSTPSNQSIFGNTLNTRGTNKVIPTLNNAIGNNATSFGSTLTSNQTVTSLNNPICSNHPAHGHTTHPTTTLTSMSSLYPNLAYPTLYKSPDTVIPMLNNVRTNFGQPLLPLNPSQSVPMLNNARFNYGQPLLNFPNPNQFIPTPNNVRTNFGQPLLGPNMNRVIPTLNNPPLLPLNPNQAIPSQMYASSNIGQSPYYNRISQPGQCSLAPSMSTNATNTTFSKSNQGHPLVTRSATTANPSYSGQAPLTIKEATKQITNSQTPVGYSTILSDTDKAEAAMDGDYENLVQELTAEIYKQFDQFCTHVEAPDIKKQNDTESTMEATPKMIPETTTLFQTVSKFIYSSSELESIKAETTFVEANYEYDDNLQDLFSKSIFNSECDSDELSKPNVGSCQTISSGEILSLKFYQL